MAKNNSEYAVYFTDELGLPVRVLPGDDLPAGAKVDNPYISGKKTDDEEAPQEEPEAPRRGRRKAADS